MTKNKSKKYTIKEISEAWFKFTSPKYLVDKKSIDVENLSKPGRVVEYNSSVQKLEIDYSRWIPYFISEGWINENQK